MTVQTYWLTTHWATGWSKRRRHVPVNVTSYSPALCSTSTGIYPQGRQDIGHPVPVMDSPEVMALPACVHCERLASKCAAAAS